jgi:guanine deaminase
MTTRPLPSRPPFALRARVLTPLADGGTRFETDGLLEVDERGRLARIGPWPSEDPPSAAVDVRPWLAMPGMVDLHAHLPQLPHVGLGAGLELLAWLERYVFPYERAYDDAEAAARLAPVAFRAFAAAGTTTAVVYTTVFHPSADATFRGAEAHGIRAVIGKVMMDRVTYDEDIDPSKILEISLAESTDLCERWNGRDDGRLRYAFTPRFAVSCTANMLRGSARLAERYGAYWQTHLSEDRNEVERVADLFPEALDYVDVYDRAGGLGPSAILAHAIHLADREVARLVQTGSRIAHCPSSNLFLASGLMPLARYLSAGLTVGLGSDVGAGPELSLFAVMRAGATVQRALRSTGDRDPVLDPLGWLRLGTFDGARALGIEDAIGSLEEGKEADLIVVDVTRTEPFPEADEPQDPVEIASRLISRPHPEMVRGAWVRGRLLDAWIDQGGAA